ncbi:MAG: ABC transporter substrate-binding protein [Betaproteobacteria bacterium]|nr:ABC transporter substrate-binding protein [Betaproteobacteria bacterium]MBI2960464.1 ABC transporter substrate-binding protein [Betaproteobacteria bacterium]
MRFSAMFVTAMSVVAFAVAPIGGAEAATVAGPKVKLGCMVPLTGKGAEWGQGAKASIEIAQQEINAKGGIGGVPLEINCYDYQTQEAEGLKIINRLVERDKVLAVVGPCFSAVFEVIAPQLDSRLKTSIISYCSSKPGLSAMSRWALRNTLTSDKQLTPVVGAWVKEYGIKKAVIIHDAEDAVSKAEGAAILPGLLKSNKVEVADILTYRTKDTDYSAQITRAKSLGIQGIALGSCYQNAAAIAKEARKQGLNVPMVGGACAGAPGFIDLAGKAAEGAYMSTAAWLEDPRPEVQAYVKKIVAKLGTQPPYSGPRSYDIVYGLKHVIENSGVTNKPGDLASDREKIRTGFAALKGFPGVAGEITMNEVRDGAGSTAILKVVNGKYIDVRKK